MALNYGNFNEYDNSKEDWTSYTERLQQYFTANDIEAEPKRRAILLSVCVAKTYQLIKNLLAPEKPTDKLYKEVVQTVKDHVEPKPSVVVQRFTFHSRIRRQGELVSNYVAELNKISEHCVFGDSLQEMLRDRMRNK